MELFQDRVQLWSLVLAVLTVQSLIEGSKQSGSYGDRFRGGGNCPRIVPSDGVWYSLFPNFALYYSKVSLIYN
jgi:hypothetical protein